MPQEQLDTEFRTRDLALAAFLCVEGHRFLRIERDDKSPFSIVIFDADDDLITDVEDYQSGVAQVEPREFQKKVHWLRNKMNPNGNPKVRRG